MSDANQMLRSYFQRWQRLEEDKAAIAEDLKNLFAEAKGVGFNTKAMRVVFREQVADDADKQAADELDVICDLYRASLAGAGRAHTREARFVTTQKASNPKASSAKKADLGTASEPMQKMHELPPHDEQTGEVFDDQPDTKVPDSRLSAADDGRPSIPSSEAERAKSDGLQAVVGQVGEEPLIVGRNSEQAVTNSNPSEPTSSPDRDEPDAGAAVSGSLSAMNARTKADVIRLLRPFCRHADDLENCPGQGSKHCVTCEKLKSAATQALPPHAADLPAGLDAPSISPAGNPETAI